MKASVFLLFVAFALVSAQNTLRYSIDDFSVKQGQSVELVLGADLARTDNPVVKSTSSFTSGCTGLLGCARDMIIEARSGGLGRTFTSNIFNYSGRFGFKGEWAVSNPKTTSSLNTLQYDGNDNSRSLDINGLGGFDLTDGGLAKSLRFSLVADLGTTFTISVYSTNGKTCTASVTPAELLGDNYTEQQTLVQIDFNKFSGSCDLTKTGAVELALPSTDAVDALVRTFDVVGLADPVTPTRTPSPSRIIQPSGSSSPSRVPPSGTPSPSPAPSPSPTPSTVPGFTWYTFDDDDNGRSPCDDERPRRTYWVSDDNVIYYYFFGAADNNVIVDEGSASSGSVLAAAISLVAAVLFV